MLERRPSKYTENKLCSVFAARVSAQRRTMRHRQQLSDGGTSSSSGSSDHLGNEDDDNDDDSGRAHQKDDLNDCSTAGAILCWLKTVRARRRTRVTRICWGEDARERRHEHTHTHTASRDSSTQRTDAHIHNTRDVEAATDTRAYELRARHADAF